MYSFYNKYYKFLFLLAINRKDNILNERTAAKSWPRNWSFLSTDYKDVS